MRPADEGRRGGRHQSQPARSCWLPLFNQQQGPPFLLKLWGEPRLFLYSSDIPILHLESRMGISSRLAGIRPLAPAEFNGGPYLRRAASRHGSSTIRAALVHIEYLASMRSGTRLLAKSSAMALESGFLSRRSSGIPLFAICLR